MRIAEVDTPVWTRESADQALKELRRVFASLGAVPTIVGSVAKKGYSANDLDVEVRLDDGDVEGFIGHLNRLGFSVDDMTTHGGSRVIRVEIPDGRFIDFFPL